MSADIIKDFYSQPQSGLGLPVFSGTRRQLGGSFLSGLARFALPILKKLGGKALGVVGRVASDVISDKKPFRESLKRRAKEEFINTIRGGGGIRKRPRYINKLKKYEKDIL